MLWPRTMTASTASYAGKSLVFVVTEDWFFASHFLPMARAAGRWDSRSRW